MRKAGRPQTRSGIFFELRDQTTELYEVDGVKYLLLGGGGAQQDPILPGRTAIKLPAGYPPDLYWKGQRLGPAASIGIGDERGSSLPDRAANDCRKQRLTRS